MATESNQEDRSADADTEKDHPHKLEGYEFWKKRLNAARLIVAPMVDQSELAWRLLSRRYGAQLCYTPMYHASVFIRDVNYRREALRSCKEDRPLIVQFCANEVETFLKAAHYAEEYCDGIDLNLGCPQQIAKRGHYGAFLQDEWDLLYKMVNACHKNLRVPVTCKIRVFEDVEKTVNYAKMLEQAGCQLLTVHGRTIEQKGIHTGLASWAHIKAVRENVKIPVFANGNIQYLEDVDRCIAATGVDGVMSAEGNLHNPALFSGKNLPVYKLADEYLGLVDQYPCPLSYVRGHMFKLVHHVLNRFPQYRHKFGVAGSVTEFKKLTAELRRCCLSDEEQYEKDPTSWKGHLPLPYWICQPYVRPDPENTKHQDEKRAAKKRVLEEVAEDKATGLSKNKLKKLKRNPNKKFVRVDKEEKFAKCIICSNPKGLKCVFDLCRACCKERVHKETRSCPGHKLWHKPKARTGLKETSGPLETVPSMSNASSPRLKMDSVVK